MLAALSRSAHTGIKRYGRPLLATGVVAGVAVAATASTAAAASAGGGTPSTTTSSTRPSLTPDPSCDWYSHSTDVPVPTSLQNGLAVFSSALTAADPHVCVTAAIKYVEPTSGDEGEGGSDRDRVVSVGGVEYAVKGRVIVVGGGKAAVAMAVAVEDALAHSPIPVVGHVVTKDGHASCGSSSKNNSRSSSSSGSSVSSGNSGSSTPSSVGSSSGNHSGNLQSTPNSNSNSATTTSTSGLRHITVSEAAHPVANAASVAGARKVLDLAAAATEDDLVLVLISGGASALLTAPSQGLTLSDLQATTSALLSCGATIHEMNAVRKHLSAIKGGRLAEAAGRAPVVNLVLSDVVGDDVSSIGSGPGVADPSTLADCAAVVAKYDLADLLPPAVLSVLASADSETPKAADLAHTKALVVGSNRRAVDAAAATARAAGFNTLVLSTSVEGEAREVAKVYAAIAREVVESGQPIARPACIIAGGETTVSIRGSGKGGRNQELALAAALEIDGLGDGVAVLSLGTDGTDGPTDATGAAVTGTFVSRARAAGLIPEEYLERNDSYGLYSAVGEGLVKTGPTGTNVMDLCIIVIE